MQETPGREAESDSPVVFASFVDRGPTLTTKSRTDRQFRGKAARTPVSP